VRDFFDQYDERSTYDSTNSAARRVHPSGMGHLETIGLEPLLIIGIEIKDILTSARKYGDVLRPLT